MKRFHVYGNYFFLYFANNFMCDNFFSIMLIFIIFTLLETWFFISPFCFVLLHRDFVLFLLYIHFFYWYIFIYLETLILLKSFEDSDVNFCKLGIVKGLSQNCMNTFFIPCFLKSMVKIF